MTAIATKKSVSKNSKNQTMKRVPFSRNDMDKFFSLKADDEELNQFDIIAQIITPIVIMQYNDRVSDADKFRALNIKDIRINSLNPHDDDPYFIEFIVMTEDKFGYISTVEGYGLYNLYKIGGMVFAEEFIDDDDEEAVCFGRHIEDDMEMDNQEKN